MKSRKICAPIIRHAPTVDPLIQSFAAHPEFG
jgi:hypothetical protein